MSVKLIVRDGHATISNDKTVHEMPSGSIDIVAPGGRALFGITLNSDYSISISGGSICKINDVILDDQVLIRPLACNRITVIKPPITP